MQKRSRVPCFLSLYVHPSLLVMSTPFLSMCPPHPYCCSGLSSNTTAALCFAAADPTNQSSLRLALLNTSDTSVFGPTCLPYLAALQCLHTAQCNTTPLATLIQECLSLANITCPENTTLLLCHNASCDPLANCSTTPPVTMVTDPPTMIPLPNEVRFGPFSLAQLIGVVVGLVGGVLLLCLLCICLCGGCVWWWCCCGREGGEEGGGVKVGETADSAEAGMTMFNPMALEQ